MAQHAVRSYYRRHHAHVPRRRPPCQQQVRQNADQLRCLHGCHRAVPSRFYATLAHLPPKRQRRRHAAPPIAMKSHGGASTIFPPTRPNPTHPNPSGRQMPFATQPTEMSRLQQARRLFSCQGAAIGSALDPTREYLKLERAACTRLRRALVLADCFFACFLPVANSIVTLPFDCLLFDSSHRLQRRTTTPMHSTKPTTAPSTMPAIAPADRLLAPSSSSPSSSSCGGYTLVWLSRWHTSFSSHVPSCCAQQCAKLASRVSDMRTCCTVLAMCMIAAASLSKAGRRM